MYSDPCKSPAAIRKARWEAQQAADNAARKALVVASLAKKVQA